MIKAVWLNEYENLADAHAIREKVFVEELGLSRADEFNGTDGGCMHLVLYDGGEPAATGRVKWDGGDFIIGRVAVLKKFRGKRLGDFAMRLLIRKAFDSGGETQSISARTDAAGFYEKLGFSPEGAEYTEAGSPHIKMRRRGDIS